MQTRWRRRILMAAGVVVLGAVLIQLIPVARTNPPVTTDFGGPPQVVALLRKACYDCHSNETRWPWYSRVAPVSWLIAYDVAEGRDHLNFSAWGDIEADMQKAYAAQIWKEVETGEMPPFPYRMMHAPARLSDEEKNAIQAWRKAF